MAMNPFRSRLGALNFCVLQWAWIRLVEQVDEETGAHESWGLMGWVVPLTGWWSSYIRFRRWDWW